MDLEQCFSSAEQKFDSLNRTNVDPQFVHGTIITTNGVDTDGPYVPNINQLFEHIKENDSRSIGISDCDKNVMFVMIDSFLFTREMVYVIVASNGQYVLPAKTNDKYSGNNCYIHYKNGEWIVHECQTNFRLRYGVKLALQYTHMFPYGSPIYNGLCKKMGIKWTTATNYQEKYSNLEYPVTLAKTEVYGYIANVKKYQLMTLEQLQEYIKISGQMLTLPPPPYKYVRCGCFMFANGCVYICPVSEKISLYQVPFEVRWTDDTGIVPTQQTFAYTHVITSTDDAFTNIMGMFDNPTISTDQTPFITLVPSQVEQFITGYARGTYHSIPLDTTYSCVVTLAIDVNSLIAKNEININRLMENTDPLRCMFRCSSARITKIYDGLQRFQTAELVDNNRMGVRNDHGILMPFTNIESANGDGLYFTLTPPV